MSGKTMFQKEFQSTVDLIRKQIIVLGITMTDAAKKGGVSHRTLYRWIQKLQGGSYPRAVAVLKKLEGWPVGSNNPAGRVTLKTNIKTRVKK